MERVMMEEIINKYGKDIYSFCVYLTGNKHEADDLYQQIFLIAIEKNDIQIDNNPKSYLLAIAVNVWNNKKRKFLWRRNKAEIVHYEKDTMEQVNCRSGNRFRTPKRLCAPTQTIERASANGNGHPKRGA